MFEIHMASVWWGPLPSKPLLVAPGPWLSAAKTPFLTQGSSSRASGLLLHGGGVAGIQCLVFPPLCFGFTGMEDSVSLVKC